MAGRDWIRSGINGIGIIEIAIGCCTAVAVTLRQLVEPSAKPMSTFILVFLMALVSCALGIGVLAKEPMARRWLRLCSVLIAANKLLIAFGVVELLGALEVFAPEKIKDRISFVYHVAVVVFFSIPAVGQRFVRSAPREQRRVMR